MVNKDTFLNDVSEHQMEVFQDNGLYRHLRFRKPDSSVFSFHIITWPGHLTITGDMGTYIFARTSDMFKFFRPDNGELAINLGYWSEKVTAQDKYDGIEVYSPKDFKDTIKEQVHEYIEQEGFPDKEEKEALHRAIESDVLSYADDEREAMSAAMDFEWRGERLFPDFWEVKCREYTTRFIWCCYAIVWAIMRYDGGYNV